MLNEIDVSYDVDNKKWTCDKKYLEQLIQILTNAKIDHSIKQENFDTPDTFQKKYGKQKRNQNDC